jgi:hypothetical protein
MIYQFNNHFEFPSDEIKYNYAAAKYQQFIFIIGGKNGK